MNPLPKLIYGLLLISLTSCVGLVDDSINKSTLTLSPTSISTIPRAEPTLRELPTHITTQETPTHIQSTNTPGISDQLSKIREIYNIQGDEVVYFYSLDASMYGYIPLSANGIRSATTIAAGSSLHTTNGFQFAHFEPLIAYIDMESTVWISDLAMKYPTRTQTLPQVEQYQITWSPDDRFVFFIGNDTQNAFILDLQNNVLSDWPYRCSILANSPHTQKVAIWCPSIEDGKTYAVLEWEKKIWYSDQAPERIYLTQPQLENPGLSIEVMPIYFNAGWSSDGKQIAYFDIEDPQGSLVIITDGGKIQGNYPQSAYWLASQGKKYPSEAEYAISWSQNNQKIVFYGIGNSDQHCPLLTESSSVDRNQLCWQVLDASTGSMKWILNDLQSLNQTEDQLIYVDRPVISTLADYVALFLYFQIDNQMLAEQLETNELIMDISTQLDFYSYRFGLLP
jgi:hypothetical protein